MSATKLRVLLLFLGDPSRDRRVQNFREVFRGHGWRVELVAGVIDSIAAKDYSPIVLSNVRGPKRFAEYDTKLKKFLSGRSADLVMACDLYSLSAACELKAKGRARYVIYDAREIYTELPTVAHKPLSKFVWTRTERRGLAQSDMITVTAPHDVQAICDVHRFVPRSILVRNLPMTQEVARDRSLLRAYGIADEDTALVYVGGLQLGRGLEMLIKSLPTECKLLLIGDGVLKSSLESVVKEKGLGSRVIFAGSLPSEQAQRMVAACDVGISLIEPVSKSYELALPSKVFEYMHAGLPVVCSKLRHVQELFAKQEWIEFVDVGQTQSIREGIARAISKSRDEKLRSREQELARDSYHFEKDAERLCSELTRFLA